MDADSAFDAFLQAVEFLGGQSATSRVVGKSQQAISSRIKARKPLWADKVLVVEERTGISRHRLRPDIYPLPQSALATTDLEGVRR
jgi:DNA-binding transcriptional regulator YdaS (Cro superfamily)